MKKILLALFLVALAFDVTPNEYMKVSPERPVVDGQRVYMVRKGYSRRDKIDWVPFKGEFTNFYYEQGYEYTIYVKEYNTSLDSIEVVKTIARDNSEAYMKQLELKKKREARAAAKAAEAGKK
ncbi:MAG: hypothetical protein IK017_04455 [Paludibacteraceae bacterium]|nr:hypothetical protein [Paludibacteraceae bacterium]